jgi:hypothetical protein
VLRLSKRGLNSRGIKEVITMDNAELRMDNGAMGLEPLWFSVYLAGLMLLA